jgi:hypothetical protein
MGALQGVVHKRSLPSAHPTRALCPLSVKYSIRLERQIMRHQQNFDDSFVCNDRALGRSQRPTKRHATVRGALFLPHRLPSKKADNDFHDSQPVNKVTDKALCHSQMTMQRATSGRHTQRLASSSRVVSFPPAAVHTKYSHAGPRHYPSCVSTSTPCIPASIGRQTPKTAQTGWQAPGKRRAKT